MHILQVKVENFRLLQNVEIYLECQTTVIVGRNNSGKTSLTELFRRLVRDERGPRFNLEDFSLGVHEKFWEAYTLAKSGSEDEVVREALPVIKVEMIIDYTENASNLGPLSHFVIDLNKDCTKAKINIYYALGDGMIEDLFSDIDGEKAVFYKAIKERIPHLFQLKIEAEDPNDATNKKMIDYSSFRVLMQLGFINAQRALDSTTYTEKAVLGKIFEALFTAANKETADKLDQDTAQQLKLAVTGIQDNINQNFNNQLTRLVPTFEQFGYPGLNDPKLCTETVLRVEQLLSNHTAVGYEGLNGVTLPESYNGLGPRNLIFILLKLFELFKEYTTQESTPGLYLVFIEEPEAHLHPQMQSVFVRKLAEIAKFFANQYNDDNPWPVQFIVTTHSSHIANEADFSTIRYFLSQQIPEVPNICSTEVKDLRLGLSGEVPANIEFLHKYMTLTKCDLLFADKAVLIEGATERILLPKMIEKMDRELPVGRRNLSSQYLTIMEVGGAYAHIFINLLDFLNLKSLIITDIDTIDKDGTGLKCKVSEGTHTTNACIKNWFKSINGEGPKPNELLTKSETEKIKRTCRLAYQIPHTDGDACGRSFEDAFALANPSLFGIVGDKPEDREDEAWRAAKGVNKTNFAIRYAIEETSWVTPRYIQEGLRWLADPPPNSCDAGER